MLRTPCWLRLAAGFSNCWDENPPPMIDILHCSTSLRSTLRPGITCRCFPRSASQPLRLASCFTSCSSYEAGYWGETRRGRKRANNEPAGAFPSLSREPTYLPAAPPALP
jgi:hypothetical protein